MASRIPESWKLRAADRRLYPKGTKTVPSQVQGTTGTFLKGQGFVITDGENTHKVSIDTLSPSPTFAMITAENTLFTATPSLSAPPTLAVYDIESGECIHLIQEGPVFIYETDKEVELLTLKERTTNAPLAKMKKPIHYFEATGEIDFNWAKADGERRLFLTDVKLSTFKKKASPTDVVVKTRRYFGSVHFCTIGIKTLMGCDYQAAADTAYELFREDLKTQKSVTKPPKAYQEFFDDRDMSLQDLEKQFDAAFLNSTTELILKDLQNLLNTYGRKICSNFSDPHATSILKRLYAYFSKTLDLPREYRFLGTFFCLFGSSPIATMSASKSLALLQHITERYSEEFLSRSFQTLPETLRAVKSTQSKAAMMSASSDIRKKLEFIKNLVDSSNSKSRRLHGFTRTSTPEYLKIFSDLHSYHDPEIVCEALTLAYETLRLLQASEVLDVLQPIPENMTFAPEENRIAVNQHLTKLQVIERHQLDVRETLELPIDADAFLTISNLSESKAEVLQSVQDFLSTTQRRSASRRI